MATVNMISTFAAGTSNSGQGTNVGYAVIDAAGTTRIARATSATEDLDAAGNAVTGLYRVVLAIDPVWFPVRVKWDITGKVGVAGEDVIGNGEAALTQILRFAKNVAVAKFPFVMTDATTHTPKTGLTVTAQRSLNGGAFASCTNLVSELSNGFYLIDLAAADLNGNTVALLFTASGADDRTMTFVTQTP